MQILETVTTLSVEDNIFTLATNYSGGENPNVKYFVNFTVYGNNGFPLEGVSINIEDVSAEIGGVTDSNGQKSFRLVRKTYTAYFNFAGYRPDTESFYVLDGDVNIEKYLSRIGSFDESFDESF